MPTVSEKKVAPHIYKRGKTYYYRQRGKRINLETCDLPTARMLVKELKAKRVLAAVGAGPDVQASGFRRVSEVLKFYLECGCPKRNESVRVGRQLSEEQRRIKSLDSIIGKRSAHDFNVSDCRDYASERLSQFPHGKGTRAVDIELAALSCAFRWAAKHPRTSGIFQNPVEHYRPRYARSETVKHCRETQPANADELHALARWMFNQSTTQVFGWQCLFAAMIGQRCSEVIQLRVDGTGPNDPGWIHEDNLFLYRSQTHKGTASFLNVHPGLKQAIKVHREWLKFYFPNSPWWFPSPRNPGERANDSGLKQALRRACQALGLPHRTAHGLRSYFVNVLRSQGVSDWQIALQIGHKSGGRLIVETYGELLPVKLSWMPEGDPAWTAFQ